MIRSVLGMPYPSWSGSLPRRVASLLSPVERLRQGSQRLRREAENPRAGSERPPAPADGPARGPVPEPAGYAPLRMLPFRDVPVVINSFNRSRPLQRLVDWLLRAEHARIVVVDNASSYPPLLRYLAELEGRGRVTVVRLDANLGHLAVWRGGLLERLRIDSEYVYTDPDVVPAESCPLDLVGRLQAILADNPDLAVAGVGMRLDDLPDAYGHKALVLAWERQFWRAPAAPGLFHAPIDTTFALYRPGSGHALGSPAVRTGWPYLAAHEGWYLDHAAPSEEDLFYRATASPGTTHWSALQVPEHLGSAAAEQLSRHPYLIHAAPPAGADLPGYLPLPAANGEPLAGASADGIYVERGLGWLVEPPGRLAELRRIAKDGGLMVLHTGAVQPEDARALSAVAESAAGAGWRVERLTLVPGSAPRACTPPELLRIARSNPAAARGAMLHLRAEQAPRGAVRAEWLTRVDVAAPGTLDRWGGFDRIN